MKVVVIPDVHLKAWLFDRAEEVLAAGGADAAVCLMDLPDDWEMEMRVDLYRMTFDRAISFAKAHPETRWCYGNHDVSYPWGRLETGYSPYAERTVMEKLSELESVLPEPGRIAIIHRIDNVLFMHGGLSARAVRMLGRDLPKADIDTVIAAVNSASQDYLWNEESPLWLRPQQMNRKMFRTDRYKQVVGHTPVDLIYEKAGVISTDTFSRYRPGEQALLVIDTESGEFEKIKV